MARVAIVTDSTADLPDAVRGQLGITSVPLDVRFGDETFRDQVDLTTDQFLARLATADELPTTTQPSPETFATVFRSLASDYDAVVAVLLSSRLGGVVDSAAAAARQVTDEIGVEVVDSLNVSLGLGFQVLRAAELARSGLNAREIASRLRAEVNFYHLVFFVDTLDYLKRGGRIGTAASLLGTLLQLKPVLRIDEGLVVPFERARTRARAIESLKDFAADWPDINRLGVLYSTDRAEAERLVERMDVPLPPDRIVVAQLSPVLTSHVGPDVLGICVDVAEVA